MRELPEWKEKKGYCWDKRYPRAKECSDFVSRDTRFLKTEGQEAGLNAKHHVTTASEMRARGEIDPYDEKAPRPYFWSELDEHFSGEGHKEREREARRKRQWLSALVVGVLILAVVMVLLLRSKL